MDISLGYGRRGMSVTIPDRNVLKTLHMHPAEVLSDPEEAVSESLSAPIGCSALGELARGKRTACVAVCDITRPVPNRVILPPILHALEQAGIHRGDILILIATGLHRPNKVEEIVQLVGPKIARDYRIENHIARDDESHTLLGVTEGGTPAWIDRRFVEADLRIVTGFVEPHLMAGFSGGRKVVCPGLAGLETIRCLHSPALIRHHKAREGVIKGNPVHREALAVARMACVDFTLNVSLNEQRRMTGVFSGELAATHRAAVEFVRVHISDTAPAPVDMVVTTAGGAPLDATFYQTVKGATAAAAIVRPGGIIILVAECAEGLGGKEFVKLLEEYPDAIAFEEMLFRGDFFRIDQWQYQKLAALLRKAEVMLVSNGLSAEDRRLAPLPVHRRFDTALSAALDKLGPDAKIVVIPDGPYLLAYPEA